MGDKIKEELTERELNHEGREEEKKKGKNLEIIIETKKILVHDLKKQM